MPPPPTSALHPPKLAPGHAPASDAARRDRRADILLAAERLFAQRGYHAVSLRQIAAEAGVPLALVSYHHGSKQELFRAIFAHWKPTLDARLQRLAQARQQAGSSSDALPRIVQAFVEPVLQLRSSAEGEYYAMLVAREVALGSSDLGSVLHDFFDPLAHAFINALHAARPQASRVQAAWAYQFALGALLHHLCDRRIEPLSHGQALPNAAQAAPLLQRFICCGIDAVLSPPSPLPASEGDTP
ncbi:MAG: TetR/AcrR family transcriptional regulator [Comamonadaceae bacterium]|nr:TetR/AcrR family transcriptional regulator [Comamonadaceae bacterium]